MSRWGYRTIFRIESFSSCQGSSLCIAYTANEYPVSRAGPRTLAADTGRSVYTYALWPLAAHAGCHTIEKNKSACAQTSSGSSQA